MYDAIIVGGRCAGALTAMLLARGGRRVLLVDRATFPSDTLSGHAIQPAGVARLARWGLLDRVRATGCPFTPRVRFDAGEVVLEGAPTPVAGLSDTVCIRRTVLDTLLVDAAEEAGVEVCRDSRSRSCSPTAGASWASAAERATASRSPSTPRSWSAPTGCIQRSPAS
jgi:2-polyprenyl-6-methoxyphenol hydroxylase-like FAD-dependent oxidoreductase